MPPPAVPLADLPPPAATGEPIAVIGMACRFPGGADSPEALWQLLLAGTDATTPVPADRWDAAAWHDADRQAPGKTDLLRAGFLQGPIDQFDAAFFGIAPREAQAMDPQQRLVLEVAWEALERAGLAPARLAGTATGVYLGLYNNNYTLSGRGSPAPALIDGWSASGGHTSVAAGRLSFTLGLHGPSLVVDTACSSSLVALHLAVRSLRGGECQLALAGGCHLLLAPEALVASTKLGATAPDGRCKPFDASADGFGHGEGCGVVVLKRLAQAEADGDPVLAVIRGSAVNQDGRSHSLTAPSASAQEALVRRALADAGLAPRAVGYVEAHGTGTPLGDPIEVEALVAALGPSPEAPLRLGSVKANLGHLEAAAGIAGFIKAVLCLQHGELPPQPHFARLNPEIEHGASLAIATSPQAWHADAGQPRVAGVSAFGFGGTNAHVVVQEAAAARIEAAAPSPTPRTLVLPLSARSQPALRAQAGRWAAALETGALTWEDACHTAGTARNAWPLRATVVAADAATGAAALRQLAAAERPGTEAAASPRIGFLFSGQGAQYAGMARGAYASQPAFRAALDELLPTLDAALGEPALPLLFGMAPLDATRLAQPLLLAVEIALARWWEAHGITPTAVLGHSLGEYAAAVIAGALSAPEAIQAVAERGRIMDALPAGGGMLAVLAPVSALALELARWDGQLDIAAVNGPAHTVVAGPLAVLREAQRAWEQAGLAVVPLAVSHAFHSALIEPALPALQQAAAALPVRPARLPFIANLQGEPLAQRDAAYWVAHARRPVRFAAGVQALGQLGCQVLIEIGPHAVLGPLAAASAPKAQVLASLRRGRDDAQCLAEALAAAWRAGAPVDWGAQPGRRVAGPTYPFQRERHWLALPAASSAAASPPPAAAIGDTVASSSAVVYDFYDQLAVVADARGGGPEAAEAESHLTFGFLPAPVPGFSWVRALFEKAENPAAWQLLRDSQLALKRSLFDGVSFGRIRRVMDYGCGHAADLCALAQAHPQLHGQGYTLSAGQVAVGRARIERLGLASRVRVDRADSSRVPFPGAFDLVFGFEVTGLIEDKPALFDNVATHLAPGGLLVIADFIAPGEPIANPDTNSYTPSVEQWVDLFSGHGLRLVRAVDASADVADWLVDPDFEANVDALVARFGLSALTRRHLLSNQNIGRALRKDLMRYLLLTAQHSPHETEASLRAANLAMLRGAPSYRSLASTRGDAPWQRWIAGLHWPAQPAAQPLPAPADVAQALAPVVARERDGLDALQAAGAQVEALALGYAAAAFRALGCDDLFQAAQVPVIASQARLRTRLVELLQAAGPAAPQLPLATDPATLAQQHPAVAAELRLLARCGPRLAEVLQGRCDPLDLLFPGGDASDAQALYADSPFSAAVQRLAAAAVAALPRETPLNVLEIGGGTGATTRHLLDALPPASSYCFTDLGASLVARAERQLAGRGLRFAPLDIARAPVAQGFATGSFDLVVAANVLHATPDLGEAVDHAASLLRAGGWLLLVENTGPLAWGELTFGLTPGMWSFRDGDRRNHALVSQAVWRELLLARGFDAVDFLTPGAPDAGTVSRQCVILARRRVTRRFRISGGAAGEALALAQRLQALGESASAGDATADPACTDLVWLAAPEAVAGNDVPAAALAQTGAALRVFQQLAQQADAPRLHLVSHGALPLDAPPALAQAPLTGLCRSAATELPELRTRLIDLPPLDAWATAAAALAQELAWGSGNEIALRDGQRHAPVLRPASGVPRSPPTLDPQAAYLVTGAFGGVGRRLVDWLVAAGARRLLLVGRHAPAADASDWLHAPAARGVQCEWLALDVGTPGAAPQMVDAAQALGPLRGVFHAAGVVADAAITALDGERLAATFRAKVQGSWALHRATEALPLDHFVLFSSAAALLGPAGQANHAAANAAMDAIAHQRRGAGLPGLSIQWGAWAEAGAAVQGDIAARVQRSGLVHMAPADALAALGWAMAGPEPQWLIADAQWADYARRHPPGSVPSMLRELAGLQVQAAASLPAAPASAPTAAAPFTSPADTDLRASLAALPALRRRPALRDALRRLATDIMRLPATELGADSLPLRDLGLDSLMAIELRNLLAARLATRLPATLLFEHPSVAALADALAAGPLADLMPAEAPPSATPAVVPDATLAQLDAAALEALLAEELGDPPAGDRG